MIRHFLAVLTALLISTVVFGQGVTERTVRAIERLQTDAVFRYQGVDIPVLDLSYHEWSSDSVTWRKNYVDGDCYLRISNDVKTTWVGINVCGGSGTGTSQIDTVIVCSDGVCDTITTGAVTVNIPAPITITGTTGNTSTDTTHTHDIVFYVGDLEDVDTTARADGYVLKWNEVTQQHEYHPDLTGAGASGELTVQDLDGTPSISNVTNIKLENGHLTDNGAGSVTIDFSLEPTTGAQDFFRTDTVDVTAGDTFLTFSSPLPANDYIVANAYALYSNGERQPLSYDSTAVDGFRVLDIIGESEVHYLVIRNLDSLGVILDSYGKVASSNTDVLEFLNAKTDDSTITVIDNDLHVISDGLYHDSLKNLSWSDANHVIDTTVNMNGNTIDSVYSVDFSANISGLAYNAGTIYFDSTRNNFVAYDNNAEVGLDIGKEQWVDAYNLTGLTITNGQVVFIDTVNAMYPTIHLAKADDPRTSNGVIGIATHDIEDGTLGRVTTFGIVRDINTSGLTAGLTAWVSSTTAGGVTVSRPEYPFFSVQIGTVIVADNDSGQIFVNKIGRIEDILDNSWNGNFIESFNFTISSDGATVTGTLDEAESKGYLTMNFSDGFTVLDVSTPPTITLTAGTDANPQLQYVYVLQSTKALAVSTSFWPDAEHIPVAVVALRTAATTQTDGALRNQNVNDHVAGTDGQGHISHIARRVRKLNAAWESGAEAIVTIGTAAAAPDSVWVSTTAGKVWQMHLQDFPEQDMETGDDIHVVNHPTTPYATITNLNTQLTDAVSGSLSGRKFSFVVWGVQNKTGQTSHLMLNLPSGSYSSVADAITDADGYTNYSIPDIFQGVGFLIARFTFSHSTAGGGTWTLESTTDLRGSVPSNIAGGGGTGGGSGVTTFLGLTDTPASYLGQGNKIVKVAAGETALEFSLLDTISTTINRTNWTTFINNNESDPLYASDSAQIVTFSDTTSIIATKTDIAGISKDSVFVTLTTDTLFIGTDTIVDNVLANYDTTGFRITESQISDFDTEVSNNTDVSANTTHRTSTGADHTYIDQSVVSGSSPTFDGANFTGIDAGNVDIADVGAIITATDVEGALQENRTAIDLNTAKVTNATHTGEVTGATALTIADNIIEAVNLESTNSPSDDQVPSYDLASGGFTWVTSSAAPTMVYNEVPNETPNGSITAFTVDNTPTSGTVRVYINGLRQTPTTDYSVSTNTVTFTTAPFTGDVILIDYNY